MFISEAWARRGLQPLGRASPSRRSSSSHGHGFLLIRPQQKKQKEHRAMVAALKRGDRVVTNGGIYGQVSHVADDHLMIEIADGVKIKIVRDAVAAVPGKPEPVKKEEKGANDR
jgi:preprotein translocase subunit YajC